MYGGKSIDTKVHGICSTLMAILLVIIKEKNGMKDEKQGRAPVFFFVKDFIIQLH
jgi:hypothetical protein